MGRKKAFIDKKNAKKFRLIPSDPSAENKEEKFIPTQEHLEEQHKFGIYFDDDYDYTKHLRDVKKGFSLQPVGGNQNADEEDEEEETVVIRAPAYPFPFGAGSSATKAKFFDDDLDKALEGDFGEVEGAIEDNFIELAGGAMPEGSMAFRIPRPHVFDSDEEDEEDDEDYEEGYGYDDDDNMEDEEMEVSAPRRGEQREMDDAFDRLLEADYNEDQMGELDGDDDNVAGMIEPDDGRLKRLAEEQPRGPDYEEQEAKDYVRKRMALIEAGIIKDTEEEEIVEVEESTSKRMKWDCESFASQYTNCYNHPTMIRDGNARLSRKALKRLEEPVSIPEDEEMEASEDEVSVVSTFRPKGETPEQRKLRKQAVKEARRVRREEKKANKIAFGEEHRKIAKGRIGQLKAVPIT